MKWILLMKSSSHVTVLEDAERVGGGCTVSEEISVMIERHELLQNSCSCMSQINWHRFPYHLLCLCLAFLLFVFFFFFLKHVKWLSITAGSEQKKEKRNAVLYCRTAEKKEVGSSSAILPLPSLISPNYQRVSKQSDTTDLLSQSRGHDWKALPAYYDRSVMVMEAKSAPWR